MVQFYMLELVFSSSGDFTELRKHFHSSNREGYGHALVTLDIGSVDGQLSIESTTHSYFYAFLYKSFLFFSELCPKN